MFSFPFGVFRPIIQGRLLAVNVSGTVKQIQVSRGRTSDAKKMPAMGALKPRVTCRRGEPAAVLTVLKGKKKVTPRRLTNVP